MFSRMRTILFATLAMGLLFAGPNQPAAASRAPFAVTIAGSVVDGTLTPLAGVAVTLESNSRVLSRATTDAAGEFRLTAPAPGSYRVRAQKSPLPAFVRDLVVPAGATTIRFPIVLARAEDKVEAVRPDPNRGQSAQAASPPPPPPAMAGGSTAAGFGRGGAGGRGGGGVAASPLPAQIGQRTADASLYYGYRSTGETYADFEPNRFMRTLDHPLSTFGADVDTASYANVRRFLSGGQLPPSEAVRIEELVNYFRFDYPAARDGRPIGLTTEIGDCPWAPTHKLVLIGARAAAPAAREIAGRNIVLLVDVSGSMAGPERLPLIRTALGLFVDTLQPDDSLAIVTYAGSSGVALLPTPVRRRDTIQRAIAGLQAGGSTNGGQGLILAYRIAREAYVPGGVNRVILATDGDFNVGITSQDDLFRLIRRERDSGVFLSVLGVGTGNLKDQTMEMLADRGNGHYAYIDSLQEARRVLIREGDSTLETVAKDVKFQVEFNPAVVSAWKLLGYENRALAARDFNDDRKDAGEMGAGHTVTVLYEVIPAGADSERDLDLNGDRPVVDPLRYQTSPAPARPVVRPAPTANGEWLTVKVRYKQPEGDVSEMFDRPVRQGGRTVFLPMASAVAEFGLLLRDTPRNLERWDALNRRASQLSAPGTMAADVDGFRELVATARGLARLR